MSDSADRSAAASDVSGSSRLPSTIEKSHLADSGNDSFISSDCELSARGGDHSRESPQPQPGRNTSAPLQDHLVHATADLASLAENDDRSRGYEPNPCHSADHQSWRKVGGERRGKFVTFPHSFFSSVSLQHRSRVYLFCCRSEQFIDHSEIPT